MGDIEKDNDLENNDSSCAGTPRCREAESKAKPKSSIPSRSRGPKRPDKPLYMPRAARERLHLDNPQGLTGDKELSPDSCSFGHISPSPDSCSCPETTESTESSSSCREECPPSVTDHILNHAADSPVLCPEVLPLNEPESQVINHTVSSFADMTLEKDEKDKHDVASLSYRDVTEEIKAHLKEPVTVSIEHVHNDYSMYLTLCTNISAEDFPHVIEIYDFPPLFKTEDLLDAFAEYSDSGMKISWVDNTHALGVFSSESAATHALSICHPSLKVRPLVEGSKKAKVKAIRSAEFIQPVKERPRTDCAVAQRMVTRALGLQGRGRVQRY
ncbi:R3H and coiled-coil domain-containing protein 1 isoform X2 [Antennarius striatus]|uniref:R3H and coiled-coil domain-containing protein 1 isoform X2 n=1 Tax=Antennarius striatus TaxID=241820 RepID=UPI0035B2F05D